MPQVGSRKRPAPGATPTTQHQILKNSMDSKQVLPNEPHLLWNREGLNNGEYPDSDTKFNPTLYEDMAARAASVDLSNQLARRPTGQHILARPQFNSNGVEAWQLSGSRTAQDDDWNASEEELAQRALAAKRERKSIPPFVQKLSSFLDSSSNTDKTDLIRWSDSGLSFVVLDEDEFAKTLIPELFKHNNYASFVRQLNMYGFHKKVGLSDNSMRASERKNKSPNEYSNPYFRRGKPNLLWLIQKPKPVSGKGKAETRGKQDDGNFDEDGDDGHDVEQPTPAAMTFDENARNPRQPLMIGAGLPQEDLAAVHRELQAIRQQQHMIHQVITKIRQEHEQLYGQAAAFQELHNRHENSINAILTFLATVYNRSLEGYGAPTLANIFPSAIPHDLQQQNSASNVVDVGDYPSANADLSNGSLRRPNRRQQLLLQAPPPANLGVEGNATTGAMATPSILSPLGTVQSPGTPYSQPNATVSPGRQTTSRDARDQNKPSRSSQSPKFSPADKDIISIINSANSSGNGVIGSRMDFPQALSHLQTANGKSPLSQNQRNSVLQLMANGSALASPNGNNALASPSPPIVPVPGIPHWHATQAELEFLERTLKEQDDKVANLSSMLQPLSPSGSIPGLSDSPGYVPPLPGDSLDFDQLFNSGDYFNEASNGGSMNFGSGTLDFNGGSDFDFDNPTGNDSTNGYGGDSENQQGGGGLDTNGREDLSPETYTKPEDVARQQEAQSPRKRRRRG